MFLQRLFKTAILISIRIYQHIISPDHSWLRFFKPFGACKFHPTCSEYTYQAIDKYGILKGIILGVKRLKKCHPWSDGGYDPLY